MPIQATEYGLFRWIRWQRSITDSYAYLQNPMNAIDPDGRQVNSSTNTCTTITYLLQSNLQQISDQDLANAINKSVDNTINTLKNEIHSSAVTKHT